MSVFLLLTNKIQIQTKSRSPLENPEIQSKIRNPRKNPVDFEISYAKYVWRTALEVPKLRCALFGGNITHRFISWNTGHIPQMESFTPNNTQRSPKAKSAKDTIQNLWSHAPTFIVVDRHLDMGCTLFSTASTEVIMVMWDTMEIFGGSLWTAASQRS